MTKKKAIEEMTYEEAFVELEAIVASLEAGDQTLDESTGLYARGQALVLRCAELLEKTELKVSQLTGEVLKDFEAEA